MVSPFIILPKRISIAISRSFRPFARLLLKIFPFVEHDLKRLDKDADAEPYIIDSFFSGLILSVFFSIIVFILVPGKFFDKLLITTVVLIYTFSLFFGINIMYPKLKMGSISSLIDRDLSFALRDLVVQVRSGVMLYDAIVSIAEGDYGVVSKDFKEAVRMMNAGYSEAYALEMLALDSKSEYMKKIVWQIANAMQRGGDISKMLESIYSSIQRHHEREVKSYLSTMNMMILMFFLLAVTLPTLGMVFMVVLSSVGGITLDITTSMMIIGTSILVQAFMLGYMRTLRPAILR